ncbi:MAG: class I SAM-dependent methyltransferase [Anaerolineae bacterium]|nr:class I SAM-dependent methyltransferase [Anaerolineae bacterium]
MASVDDALKGLQDFFDRTIKTHGADPRGVDWKSPAAQEVRFDQLLKLHTDAAQPFSLVDYGCGYGALVGYLQARGYAFTYTGYDMTPAVIDTARATWGAVPGCTFTTRLDDVPPADYVVGSGLFNMKFAATPVDAWYDHMLATIEIMWGRAQQGLAFNALTAYSDPEYMRADLYYPDPCRLFDHCKRRLSRQVALLHDYGLYDFTLLVRREPA